MKALGIALKLTFSGTNQLIYPQTWLFTIVVVACIVTQMNYLNKVIAIFHFNGEFNGEKKYYIHISKRHGYSIYRITSI